MWQAGFAATWLASSAVGAIYVAGWQFDYMIGYRTIRFVV